MTETSDRSSDVSVQEEFWRWFMRREDKLFRFDPDNEIERERLFDMLALELQKVDLNLSFEFGPPDVKRKFIISASGIKRAFPAVISLAHAAPYLDRWEIIAFRPRRAPIYSVELGSRLIDPQDVHFTLLNNGKKAGIRLFIPGFQNGDTTLKQVGYLMLDQALGEYDVETRLGPIEMLSPEAQRDGERHPLPELPVLFDRLVARLEGRGGVPS
jgi:hypothetical protein